MAVIAQGLHVSKVQRFGYVRFCYLVCKMFRNVSPDLSPIFLLIQITFLNGFLFTQTISLTKNLSRNLFNVMGMSRKIGHYSGPAGPNQQI